MCFMLVSLFLAQEAGADHNQCTSCHILDTDPALLQPLPDLCINCHANRVGVGEHVIDVPPTASQAPELPLLNGLVSCTTCHDYHATTPGQLRLASGLCLACHQL